MAQRSDIDKLVGGLIRLGMMIRCPYCGAIARWVGVPEYANHREMCARIELGQIVGEMPPPDDLIPTVKKKPRGWEWVKD